MTEQFLEQSVDEFPGLFRWQRRNRAIRTYGRTTRALKRWCTTESVRHLADQESVFLQTVIPREESLLPRTTFLKKHNPSRKQITDHALRLLANNVETAKEVADIESSIRGKKVKQSEWRAFLRAADKYTEEERA